MTRASDTFAVARFSGLLTALGPLLAVALPWLMRLTGLAVERYGPLPAYVFTGVFVLVGSSNSGRMIGLMTLLLDIAPEEERASYVGLVNTVLGVVSLLPILSGALIDRIGFEPTFAVAAGLLLLGYLITLRVRPATR
jgi:MFS family permease